MEQIKKLNEGHTGPQDYLALTNKYRLTNESNINRTLKSIESNATTSVKGCRVHCLRHTFASYMIYKGADIVTLSKILGHSKPSVTMNEYVDIIEEQKTNAIDKFNNLFIEISAY